jgi:hypothetical protein
LILDKGREAVGADADVTAGDCDAFGATAAPRAPLLILALYRFHFADLLGFPLDLAEQNILLQSQHIRLERGQIGIVNDGGYRGHVEPLQQVWPGPGCYQHRRTILFEHVAQTTEILLHVHHVASSILLTKFVHV